MNRVMFKDPLAQAERRIAEGREHVERQRQIVEELVQRGDDARRSTALLELFEDTLAKHIEERDRLRNDLAEIAKDYEIIAKLVEGYARKQQ